MHEADRATTHMTSPTTTSSLPELQVSVRDDHMQGCDYRSEHYARSHVGWNHRPSLRDTQPSVTVLRHRVFPLAPSFITQLASWKRARQVVPGPDQTTGRRKVTSGPTRSMSYMQSKNSSRCEGVKSVLCGAWMNTLMPVRSSPSLLGKQFTSYRA